MTAKTLFIILSLIICQSVSAQNNAPALIDSACEQATMEEKNIFLIFTNEGCGWCRRMIKNMNDESCKDLFEENYIIIEMNVYYRDSTRNTQGSMKMFHGYNDEKSGIPFWVILNREGNLLEDSFGGNVENIGCPTEKEVDEFLDILDRTSKLRKRELTIISKAFISERALMSTMLL